MCEIAATAEERGLLLAVQTDGSMTRQKRAQDYITARHRGVSEYSTIGEKKEMQGFV